MITTIKKPADSVMENLNGLWLSENHRIKQLPAETFRNVDPQHLRYWMHVHAVYCLPTRELVTFLMEEINNKHAIEICSGNADLYYHLDIPGTDSCIQQTPEMQLFYAAIQQPATAPYSDVFKFDAEKAVKVFTPQVVVGAYVTRKFIDGIDITNKAQASVYGVDEESLIASVEKYIHVGNHMTHGQKTALKLPHREVKLPGLVTRGSSEQDIIYIWEK